MAGDAAVASAPHCWGRVKQCRRWTRCGRSEQRKRRGGGGPTAACPDPAAHGKCLARGVEAVSQITQRGDAPLPHTRTRPRGPGTCGKGKGGTLARPVSCGRASRCGGRRSLPSLRHSPRVRCMIQMKDGEGAGKGSHLPPLTRIATAPASVEVRHQSRPRPWLRRAPFGIGQPSDPRADTVAPRVAAALAQDERWRM